MAPANAWAANTLTGQREWATTTVSLIWVVCEPCHQVGETRPAD
jgi:hypothetical protein